MKQKLYECKKCGNKVIIRSKGLCTYCRSLELSQKKRKSKQKKSKTSSSFFDNHIALLEENPYSQESGKYIKNIDRKNICHILPKRDVGGFPSLREEDKNIVYLTWQEHSDFDRLLDRHDFKELEIMFPNTWNHCLQVLPELLKDCSERNKLYFSIKNYIDNE